MECIDIMYEYKEETILYTSYMETLDFLFIGCIIFYSNLFVIKSKNDTV